MLAALAAGVALAAALVVAVVGLSIPTSDLPELLGVLALAGGASLATGGILLWTLGHQQGRRISARLITAHIIGVLVVVLTVGISAALLFDSSHDFERLGLVLAYAVAVASIYSAFVSGWFTGPLTDIGGVSRRLAEGDLSARMPDTGEKEFADLGMAMNTMAGRLQFAYQRQRTLEESQRYLVAAVISELQEPVSALQRNTDSLLRSADVDPSSLKRLGIALQRDLDRQEALIRELEVLADIDAGRVAVELQPVVLSGAVLAACEKLHPQSAMLGVTLLPRVDFAIAPVLADPDQLATILQQLIDSAMREGRSGDSVLIETLDLGIEAQVNVASSGSPYGARTAPFSVGLVLARRLIELNQGRVWTAQPLTGGLVTSFTLPKIVQ
ncbi:MAG: HAMP domain-containing histidine kinase [Thermomicrobiales bacterium]|nr:HAMP domain-containing histidine kinase [Thermomicrobiales bacterium]